GYDKQNRLNAITSIVGAETNTFTYSYLSCTQIISGYTATTPSTGTTNIIVTRTYEPNRDLISTVTNSFVALVPSVVSSFSYYNDSTGKRTGRIDYYNGSTVTNTFDYNIRDEVTNAVMNLDVQNIVYDDIGNREQSTVYNDQSAVTNLYVANQLNQYTSMNSGGSARNLTHDDDGNLTFDGAQWHHAYDGENRLSSSSNLTSGVYCEYAYDYQSRRISKTTLTPSPYSSLTTKYIWDGWNIAAEIIIDHVNSSTNISYYTWGLDLSGTLQGAGGVGGLLCDTKVRSSETNTYFAVGDANGNITEYIDNTGATAAHGGHSAFGETKISGSMKDDFTHWFSTKPFAKETGFVVYQQRYYDPILCRWLSKDPIGIKGGLNEYGFVGNDGVNHWDKLGLSSSKICCNVNTFEIDVKGWNGGWPSLFGKLYSKQLEVKFKLSLNKGSSKKYCIIEQHMKGEVKVAGKHTGGPWSSWKADGNFDAVWWSGTTWYSGGGGRWSFNGRNAAFYDAPGIENYSYPRDFPVYYGGVGGKGHFQFRTRVIDKNTKSVVRELFWGILVDYKTPTSGASYFYL
ncbi:MAG: hypothetical protein M0P27_06655, partial [Bacteroidales bacterium]|nr:hypothetical protein [Bacteroidales bacterium]